jgi:two-component system cell cycle sensor histidine kinase/response regulator CckA
VRREFENAPYGVVLVDAALEALWMNAASRALLEHVPLISAHHPLAALRLADGSTLEDRARESFVGGAAVTNLRVAAPVGIGGSRAYSAALHPVRGDGDALVGVCCLLTDVTDESRLVEALWQTQKLEAAGQLANVFAHDFNNLLAVIQGYCDLLLMKVTDDVLMDRLGKIRSAAVAAAGLSRQLLLLTRPGPGEIAAVDLTLVLRAMKTALERALPPEVKRSFDFEENLGLAVANAAHAEQIVMTLVMNALQAMPNGGTLAITTRGRTVTATEVHAHGVPVGSYVCLAVRDTGVGMDDATRARLFDPGFTTKADGGGAGMGLLVARTLMQRLCGAITVESSPGAGTTVSVWFPRPAAEPAAIVPTPWPEARRPCVLFAEPDDSVRDALGAGLSAAGALVLPASNWSDTLRIARSHAGAVDVLLASDSFADGHGAALADAVGNVRPGIAVLIASTRHRGPLAPERAATHRYPTIAKPCTLEQLIGQIARLLHPASPGIAG